jgi:hypothetical protein
VQLRVVVLVVVTLCGRALAEDSFTAKTQIYADSDHTTVVSPLVAMSRDAWRGGNVAASYVADVVSSASIDVVSNATRHMSDFRSEITAAITQKIQASTLSASYIYSVENDYQSHNAHLGLAQDLFQRNSTLSVGGSFSSSSVGRTGDQTFHRTLRVGGIDASWTQTLGPKTIGQLGYSFTYDAGYEASPYRFVPVASGDGNSFKVPETMPDRRHRHAIVLALNRYLFDESALQLDYRIYVDSWALLSHTVQLRYLVTFRDITLRLRERFYYQRGVYFYKPAYTEVEPFMTTDRESSTLWSNLAGVKIAWRLPVVHRALELEAKGDFLYIRYVDYPLLARRFGGTAELGLNVIY